MSDNEKLLEAARMIQNHCKHTDVDGICPFSPNGICNGTAHCGISGGRGAVPGEDWEISKPRRWTKRDIALAKALKPFGVEFVERWNNSRFVRFGAGEASYETDRLPDGSFPALEDGEKVQLSDIIAEGESQ